MRDRGRAQLLVVPFLVVLTALSPATMNAGPIIEQNAMIPAGRLAAREQKLFEDSLAEITRAKRVIWMKAADEELDDFARSERLPEKTEKKLLEHLSIIVDQRAAAWGVKFRPHLENYAKRQEDDLWRDAIFWIGQPDKVASTAIPEDFTRPLDDPARQRVISECLSPEQAAQWTEFHARTQNEKSKSIAALVKSIRETRMAAALKNLGPIVCEAKGVLALSGDRSLQVEQAAKAAAGAYAERSVERTTELLRNEEGPLSLDGATCWLEADPATEVAPPRAIYREALLSLLTREEIQQLVEVDQQRVARQAEARARQGVLGMDAALALTAEQCKALERLATVRAAMELAQASDVLPLDHSHINEYLGSAIFRVAPDVLGMQLDSAQRLRREKQNQNYARIQLRKPDAEMADQADEFESELRAMGQQAEQKWRKETAATYLLHVEDIARTVHPRDDVIAHLNSAAHGITEKRMDEWRNVFERKARAAAENYAPLLPDGKMTLAAWGDVTFNVLNSSDYPTPENDAAWKATIRSALSPNEWSQWEARRKERALSMESVGPPLASAEFDAFLRLTPAQVEKLKPIIRDVIKEYAPSFASRCPSTGGFGWQALSSSVLLPFLGAEAQVREILTPDQWELWMKDERHAAALEIWKEVQTDHERRAHPAKP